MVVVVVTVVGVVVDIIVVEVFSVVVKAGAAELLSLRLLG